jgi:hypothetical protein
MNRTVSVFDGMTDEQFDDLTNMVLSDMRTEVPQSFRDAIKDAPPPRDVRDDGYSERCLLCGFRHVGACQNGN